MLRLDSHSLSHGRHAGAYAADTVNNHQAIGTATGKAEPTARFSTFRHRPNDLDTSGEKRHSERFALASADAESVEGQFHKWFRNRALRNDSPSMMVFLHVDTHVIAPKSMRGSSSLRQEPSNDPETRLATGVWAFILAPRVNEPRGSRLFHSTRMQQALSQE